MTTLEVSAGPQTEEILQFILDGLGEKIADDVEIRRTSAPVSGLGGEPVTTAAIITLSVLIVPIIARLIERWMEQRRQLQTLVIVKAGFEQSSEAGQALAAIAQSHAQISISYTLTPTSDPKAP